MLTITYSSFFIFTMTNAKETLSASHGIFLCTLCIVTMSKLHLNNYNNFMKWKMLKLLRECDEVTSSMIQSSLCISVTYYKMSTLLLPLLHTNQTIYCINVWINNNAT